MKRNHKLNALLLLLASSALLFGGCAHQNTNQTKSASTVPTSQVATSSSTKTLTAYAAYQSGTNPVIQVNNGQSTLDPNSWQTNHVVYSKRDSLGRTSSPATAYLEQRNVANDSLRTEQTVKPTGWHQVFDSQNQAILNRGHIIAYSLSKGITKDGNYDPSQQSGDQNNPNNLFTQTAFCNQELQTVYETKVRQALEQGKKVIYQVQPVFQGSDLMPYGVQMQAISTDRSLNFNVFLYNVQPGYVFNYQDGTSKADSSMTVPKIPGSPNFNDNRQSNNNQTYQSQRNHPYARAAARGAAAAAGYHVMHKVLNHHHHRERTY